MKVDPLSLAECILTACEHRIEDRAQAEAHAATGDDHRLAIWGELIDPARVFFVDQDFLRDQAVVAAFGDDEDDLSRCKEPIAGRALCLGRGGFDRELFRDLDLDSTDAKAVAAADGSVDPGPAYATFVVPEQGRGGWLRRRTARSTDPAVVVAGLKQLEFTLPPPNRSPTRTARAPRVGTSEATRRG